MNDKTPDLALSRDFHGRLLRLRGSAVVGKPFGNGGDNGVEYTALFDAVNRQASCDWEDGKRIQGRVKQLNEKH